MSDYYEQNRVPRISRSIVSTTLQVSLLLSCNLPMVIAENLYSDINRESRSFLRINENNRNIKNIHVNTEQDHLTDQKAPSK